MYKTKGTYNIYTDIMRTKSIALTLSVVQELIESHGFRAVKV